MERDRPREPAEPGPDDDPIELIFPDADPVEDDSEEGPPSKEEPY